MERAGRRGFRAVRQIVIDRAQGDFVWDMDGKRYIDFQNGWATNPLGNCHPEVIEAVTAANAQYGFHYDHPLCYDLAERLAEIMPQQALPRTNYEVSGTEAAEAAVHLALTHTRRRYIITFASSYHGMGLATKVLSGLHGEYSTYLEAWGGGVLKAPYPYSERIPAGMSEEQYTDYCLWYLDNHIPSSVAARDNIAGIMVEHRIATGPREGQKVFTLQTLPAEPDAARREVAESSGFSLHAGMAAKASQRDKVERLARYVSRPPVATGRLSLTQAGTYAMH